MAQLSKSISSLLIDPKYSDLEIRCEGRSYYVHCVIVCSRSEVFARECDGAFKEGESGVVEHTAFDALTLERMLQYIYMDDYTVSALPVKAENEKPIEPLDSAAGDVHENAVPKCLPPHARGKTAQELLATRKPTAPPTPRLVAVLPAVAHVYVYAMAEHYGLPGLQELALEKFSDLGSDIENKDFAEVARAVYVNTIRTDCRLRGKIIALALRRIDELMACTSFLTALAEIADLQVFAAHLLPVAYLQARTSEDEAKGLKSVIAMQQKDLATTQMALQTSVAGEAKATHLAAQHMAKLLAVEQSLADKKTQADQLDHQLGKNLVHLDNAKAKIHGLQANVVEATELACQRLAELLTARQSLAEEGSKANRLDHQLTRRLNEVHDAKAKIQNLQATNSSLETEKNKVFADLLKAQEGRREAIASRDSSAPTVKKRNKVLSEVMNLVLKYDECRNTSCREEFTMYLDWDDRTTSADRGLMLRCGTCGCRHWG